MKLRSKKTIYGGKSDETRERGNGPQCVIAPPSPVPQDLTALANLPTWQKEYATRLHRHFLRVESRRKKQGSVNACLKPFVRHWRGRTYRTDSERRVRLSLGTVRRRYYDWRDNGRKPLALVPHYFSTPKKIPSKLINAFIRQCAKADVFSMAEAFRTIRAKSGSDFPSASTFYRNITTKQRSAIRQLHAANKSTAQARRRFDAVFEHD